MTFLADAKEPVNSVVMVEAMQARGEGPVWAAGPLFEQSPRSFLGARR
jgi:hypothetical protein